MLPLELVGVCRLCLLKEQVDISIFENGSKETYYKISTCLPITISSEDELPKKICLNCYNKVNIFYDFWNQTLETEKHLLSWLNAETDTFNNFDKQSQPFSYSGITENLDDDDNIHNHNIDGDSDENHNDSDVENDIKKSMNERNFDEYDEFNVPKNNHILSVDYQDEKPGPSGFQEEQSSALKQLQGLEDFADSMWKKSPSFYEKHALYEIEQNDKEEQTEQSKKIKKIRLKLKNPSNPTATKNHMTNENGKKSKKNVKIKFEPYEESTFKCRHCNEEFDTSAKRSRHEKSVHVKRDILYNCDKCNYSTYTKACFTAHLKRHIKQYSLFCEECNVGFFNNTELTSHNIKLHDMQPFQCALCNDLFTSKGNLYSHITSHDPNNTYVCEICGRTYKKKNSYKRHIARSHLGLTTKAQCSVCQKVLSSKEHLRRHMLTHTDERNWVCSTCGKCFLSKTYLTEHSRIHLGIRPYKCEICEKCFTQRGSLTIHKRSHTGERPYRCQYCNKGFVMSTLLRYHLKKCNEAKAGGHLFTQSVINTAPVAHVDFNRPKVDIIQSIICDNMIESSTQLDPLNNCMVIHCTK